MLHVGLYNSSQNVIFRALSPGNVNRCNVSSAMDKTLGNTGFSKVRLLCLCALFIQSI